MKNQKTKAIALLLLAGAELSASSGEFINLDFERGYQSTPMIIGPLPDGSGIVNREWWLPGWDFGVGLIENPFRLPYNEIWSGASDGGTLYGPGYYFGRIPVAGNLAILGFRSSVPITLVRITQSGTIPAEAKSMWYDCVNGPWEVTINGIKLELYDAHRGTKPEMEFREIGVDVSEWAGKEVELRLTQAPGWTFNAVDNIRFSAEAIPEPGHASLLLIGSAALWIMSRL